MVVESFTVYVPRLSYPRLRQQWARDQAANKHSSSGNVHTGSEYMEIQYHTGSLETKLRLHNACILPIFLYGAETWSVTVIIKEDRRTGQLVPQTDSQCPLVRIRHQWWDTLSYGAATSVQHCSQSSSVLLWPSALHRPLTRPLPCSTGLHLGPTDDWRRRIGRARQSWLRTVEADLRPMNLGLQQLVLLCKGLESVLFCKVK